MEFLPRPNRAPSRRCRAFLIASGSLEVLELRSLLSSAAVIQWSMLPQIANDPLHGDVPDLPNTSAYVNPPNGYGVLFSASQSIGIQPTTTFAWTITDSAGHTTPMSGENPTTSLPQGHYTVALTATDLSGSNGPQYTTADVNVKDVLIVAIGDSIASGEGNPVVPSPIDPQWAYSPDPAMNTQNANAHRSTLAGPAQFALQLQEANPQEAVTFVSVANSGATIPDGLLGPMQSIGDSQDELPAEIDELKQIIGTRQINVLTLTVGADDILFRETAEELIANTYIGYPSRAAILSQFKANLAELPGRYAELAQAINALHPGQVLVTGYPDITRDQNGNVAAIIGPADVTLISKKNAKFASELIIPALDATIAAAVKTHGWTQVTGINTDFRTHGYPSTDSWVRTLGESLVMQGDDDGTFHPNEEGQLDFARHFLEAYMATLRKGKAKAENRGR